MAKIPVLSIPNSAQLEARQAKAINAVKLIQQNSLEKGLEKTTLEEIDKEIKKIRKQSKFSKNLGNKKSALRH
jgi:hypothetical protein